jgi:Tfp pilus assembly protein PilZ
MGMDAERRIERRLDKVFSIYISGAWGTAFGIARNIGEGGMFIETPDPYPLGSKMEITFSFPGSQAEMVATAEVVHLCFLNDTPAGGRRRMIVGMGVRFLEFCDPEPPVHTVEERAALQ